MMYFYIYFLSYKTFIKSVTQAEKKIHESVDNCILLFIELLAS